MTIDDILLSGTELRKVPDAARKLLGLAGRALHTETRVAAAARELVAGLLAEPWGQVSVSVYETGRLVSLAPWLAGHAPRVEFLLAAQRPDGGWGARGGYALVPTLSATEALLAELRREDSGGGRDAVVRTTWRGLGALRRWSHGHDPCDQCDSKNPCDSRELPDMPAIELIVPALTAMVNGHLAAMGEGEPLELPPGMSTAKLSVVRTRLASGAAVPQKVLHALEVAGETAAGAPGVVPSPIPSPEEASPRPGEKTSPRVAVSTEDSRPPEAHAIGASPAAGAAWLGVRGSGDEDSPVRRYLETVAAHYGGPVPCAVPVTVFERSWTLSWLRRAGVPVTVPEELVTALDAAIGPGGTAAGPGLPPDADTTSVGLYALALLRAPREPGALWTYETETHFCTWQGEEGASPTVNAHVLDAFGEYLRVCADPPEAAGRYAAAVRKLAAWLRDCQRADGSWLDRWHASPYYATACCALALQEYGGAESAGAVRAAVRWLLGTQREDGSWGCWEGTAEETAYALQTLLLTAPARADPRAVAVERGHRRLLAMVTGRGEPIDAPALWHDKDLYFPSAIVRAAILGALHLAVRARPPE
ncbi:prenyltransferase/squalene oxidase repeat-containing protein [Streptosporangium sp. NPDC051023]|uniref:prenyltransferase/squalene oxidase repeat-containing protein n=1 Tax=Streptosporangium sp. NPDC051023 TaxID=3155410 RepID=UPI00344F0491